MKKRYVLIVGLILTILSVSVVSAGFFDGLMGGKEAQDNIIKIDNIEFNTTNVTKFKLENESNVSEAYWKYYVDENSSGYNVWIYNDSKLEIDSWNSDVNYIKNNMYGNTPSQTVNGVVVYTTKAGHGEHVGQPRYDAYVENHDLKSIVRFSTPDPNETAKMALTLKF